MMCGVFGRWLLTLVNGKLVISYPLHIVVCKLMIELKGGYLIYGVLDEKILTFEYVATIGGYLDSFQNVI